jgi:hypothetical protein
LSPLSCDIGFSRLQETRTPIGVNFTPDEEVAKELVPGSQCTCERSGRSVQNGTAGNHRAARRPLRDRSLSKPGPRWPFGRNAITEVTGAKLRRRPAGSVLEVYWSV